MRVAHITYQPEATPEYPYNVQIWQNRAYSGEGRFCKDYGEALVWAIEHDADMVREYNTEEAYK